MTVERTPQVGDVCWGGDRKLMTVIATTEAEIVITAAGAHEDGEAHMVRIGIPRDSTEWVFDERSNWWVIYRRTEGDGDEDDDDSERWKRPS